MRKRSFILLVRGFIVFFVFSTLCTIAVSCGKTETTTNIGDFKLLTPITGAESVNLKPTFTWEEAENAESYKVRISKNAEFTNEVLEYDSDSTTFAMTESLSIDTTYYWTVLAISGSTQKYATKIWMFTTIHTTATKTGAFTLTAPANGETDVVIQPLFSWGNSSDATNYTLEVSKTEDFSSSVLKKENIFTPYFSFLINSMYLDAEYVYYWRVTALANGLEGTVSSVYTFSTEKARPWEEFASDLLTGWRKADTYSGIVDDLMLCYEPWGELDNGNSLYVSGTIEQSTYVQVSYGFQSNGRSLATANGIELWIYPKMYQKQIGISITLSNGYPNVYYSAFTLEDLAKPTLLKIPFASMTPRTPSVPVFDKTDFQGVWINIGDAGLTDLGAKTGSDRLSAGQKADFALCFDNITGYYDEEITTTVQIPLAPDYEAEQVSSFRPISPADNDDRVMPKPNFRWEASAHADLYHLQISKTEDFASLLLDEEVNTFKYTMKTELDFETQYYWRVVASGEGIESYTSDIFTFTTLDEEGSKPEIKPDLVVNMSTIEIDELKYSKSGGSGFALNVSTSTVQWVSGVEIGTTLKLSGSHTGNWTQINYWGMGACNASGYKAVSFYILPEECDANSTFSLELAGARYSYKIMGSQLQQGIPMLVTIPLSEFKAKSGGLPFTDSSGIMSNIYITFESSSATDFVIYFSDLRFIDDDSITEVRFEVKEGIPAIAPTAPQGFTATVGDGQVALLWTAPTSNGGAAITKYEVSKDNGATWTDATSKTGHTFTGLTNGTSYIFKVRAVNSAGSGAEASATATPRVAPSAPQGFTATAGNTQVVLTWTAPTSNGGAEITKYEVSKDNGTTWIDATSNTSHTFTGLTNGTSYTFKVRAVNSVGFGAEVSATATPRVAPTAPQNLTAIPRNGLVELTWTAPVSNGGAEITKYEVSKDNGTTWTDATSNTGHTFTGLTNGTSYTFKVRAVNSAGSGAEASTTATPVAANTAPTAPQDFTATAGNTQVVLAWTAPVSDGGATITKYEVSKDDGSTWTVATSETGHTFTGLTNGTSYTFKVRAVNAVGNGTASTIVATPATTPSAPQGFTATAGDTQVELTWTAPTSNGGATITKYEVSKDSGTTWTVASSDTGHTFTGLTNGTSYTFKVRAENSVGFGAEASATATPVAPKKEDKILDMTILSIGGVNKYDIGGGDATKDLTPSIETEEWVDGVILGSTLKIEGTRTAWLQYKYFGFGSIDLTGYTAVSFYLLPQYYLNTAASFRFELVSGSTRYRYLINTSRFNNGSKPLLVTIPLSSFLKESGNTPLTEDTVSLASIDKIFISIDQLSNTYTEFAYYFSNLTFVDDYNVTETFTVKEGGIPATAPTAPQGFTATVGDGQVALLWTAPTSNGGAIITKYEVSKDNGATWTDATSETGHIFTELTNGTSYIFKVRAVNSAGFGAEASATATPIGAPSAPQGFTATAGDTQVELTWTAPTSNGGAEITKYEVSKDNGETWTNASSNTSHTFTGLTNGTSYTFKVRAVNAVGNGTVSTVVATPATTPSAPQGFTATAGNTQVELTWTAPTSNGGAEISKYEVSKDNGATWTDATTSTGHTFTGLTNGTSYTFKVRAVNSAGSGTEASTTATPVAANTAPTAPQDFTATAGNTQVVLAWTAPVSDGGEAIIKYEVSNDDGSTWTDASSNTGHTFTELTNGTSYTFKVRAVNAVGNGTASTIVATPATTPSAPQGFTATAGDTQVELTWTAPTSNGGAEITKYEVSKDSGTTWTDASSDTGHIFTGLTNGTSYTFKVRAVNSVGFGAEASATATPVAPKKEDKILDMTILSIGGVNKYDIGGGDATKDLTPSIETEEWVDGVTLGSTLKIEGTRTAWLQYKYFGFGSIDLTGYTAVSFYLLPQQYLNTSASFRFELVSGSTRYRRTINTSSFVGNKPLLVTIPLSSFLKNEDNATPLTEDTVSLANITSVYITLDLNNGPATSFTYYFSNLTFVDDYNVTETFTVKEGGIASAEPSEPEKLEDKIGTITVFENTNNDIKYTIGKDGGAAPENVVLTAEQVEIEWVDGVELGTTLKLEGERTNWVNYNNYSFGTLDLTGYSAVKFYILPKHYLNASAGFKIELANTASGTVKYTYRLNTSSFGGKNCPFLVTIPLSLFLNASTPLTDATGHLSAISSIYISFDFSTGTSTQFTYYFSDLIFIDDDSITAGASAVFDEKTGGIIDPKVVIMTGTLSEKHSTSLGNSCTMVASVATNEWVDGVSLGDTLKLVGTHQGSGTWSQLNYWGMGNFYVSGYTAVSFYFLPKECDANSTFYLEFSANSVRYRYQIQANKMTAGEPMLITIPLSLFLNKSNGNKLSDIIDDPVGGEIKNIYISVEGASEPTSFEFYFSDLTFIADNSITQASFVSITDDD